MKKVIYIFAYLAFLILSFEAISYIGYYIYQGKAFSYAELNNYRTSLSQQTKSNFASEPIIAHPYLGNVHNPDSGAKIGAMGVNEYGFIDDKGPVQKKSENKVVVGIFGASVAWWFSTLGYQDLIDHLQSKYPNKQIDIIRLALGGNKQPQQLMILNYLLMKNAEFDLIINIDGFNEIAIPPTHNKPKGVNPSFPAYWSDFFNDAGSSAERELLAKILITEQERKNYARIFSHFPLKQSIAANLFWLISEKNKIKKSENLKLEKQKIKSNGEVPYILSGPRIKFDSENKYYDSLTNNWMYSSLLMDQICKARGIKYFHFLQPNQYLPGSKPMKAEELKIAIDPTAHWEKPVLAGYPYLIKKGAELKAKGVNFFDLTQIFKNDERTLYLDNCCHFNIEGNQLLGKKIGQIITDNL